MKRSPDDFCVICGAKTKLTLHHIVPRCIRKHFPRTQKAHSPEWCVLLCEPCHAFAEEKSREIYNPVLRFYQCHYHAHPSLSANNAINILTKIKQKKLNEAFTAPNLVAQWLHNSMVYTSLDEVPNTLNKDDLFDEGPVKQAVSQQNILNWIRESGGIRAVEAKFKEAFLKTKPLFYLNEESFKRAFLKADS